jgi:hypothetical protein
MKVWLVQRALSCLEGSSAWKMVTEAIHGNLGLFVFGLSFAFVCV